jgi:hypothetical protein
MSNDAKLGLLAGVIGVVVAALLAGTRPSGPPVGAGGVAPQAASKTTPEAQSVAASPPAPAVFPADLTSAPMVRTRREPDVMPASRPTRDGDIDP